MAGLGERPDDEALRKDLAGLKRRAASAGMAPEVEMLGSIYDR